jgi:hypothetical protein
LAKEDERTKAAPRGRSPAEIYVAGSISRPQMMGLIFFFVLLTETGTVASLPVFSIIFTDEVTKAREVPASVKPFCPSVKLDYVVVYLLMSIKLSINNYGGGWWISSINTSLNN